LNYSSSIFNINFLIIIINITIITITIIIVIVQVAVREPILLPTRFGEDTFCSWSGLTARSEVLKGAMDMFAGYSLGVGIWYKEKQIERENETRPFLLTLSSSF
jgi:hypothetical protein